MTWVFVFYIFQDTMNSNNFFIILPIFTLVSWWILPSEDNRNLNIKWEGALCGTGFDTRILNADLDTEVAPLFEDMGDLSYKIHTLRPETQLYFDQGLTLIYGFNHNEAYRSLKYASTLDPLCAMTQWGMAIAMGPNINDGTPSNEREQIAYEAITKALTYTVEGSKEFDLIKATASRFADTLVLDRKQLNESYYQAMVELTKKYPSDFEILTLCADAAMNTMPWDYYLESQESKPRTDSVVAMLEKVIKNQPKHPGAHHLYIHIVEASKSPDRGEASADILGSLVPGSGHLVHMPSHIYARIGRYQDAVISNKMAVVTDEIYIAQCQAKGVYPLGYYPHNLHFLWMAATLTGQEDLALESALKVADKIPLDIAPDNINSQNFLSVPLQTYVRFGKWNEILTTPAPDSNTILTYMYWHYARSIAFTKKMMFDQAADEITLLESMIANVESDWTEPQDTREKLHEILTLVPKGEYAFARGDYSLGEYLLRKAVLVEDQLPYNEPPEWHHPVRQILGSHLLATGAVDKASVVFSDDLEKLPNNGWSLFGLLKCQESVASRETTHTRKLFEQAWQYADFDLERASF